MQGSDGTDTRTPGRTSGLQHPQACTSGPHNPPHLNQEGRVDRRHELVGGLSGDGADLLVGGAQAGGDGGQEGVEPDRGALAQGCEQSDQRLEGLDVDLAVAVTQADLWEDRGRSLYQAVLQ